MRSNVGLSMRPTFSLFGILLLVLAMPIASADPFQDVRNATSDFLDTTSETAGYFFGPMLIVVIVILGMAATSLAGKGMTEKTLFLFASFGLIFNVVLTWWPPWTAILVVLLLVSMMIGIPGVSKDE